MIQKGARDVHDPLLGLDIERLEKEMESMKSGLMKELKRRTKSLKRLGQKGLDHSLEVEIPRASDLASRTEKLLVEHSRRCRKLQMTLESCCKHDRETTSIKMATIVAKRFRDNGYDLQKSIDVGLESWPCYSDRGGTCCAFGRN